MHIEDNNQLGNGGDRVEGGKGGRGGGGDGSEGRVGRGKEEL